MEQLANMPVWAQILFMFINGLIGGGHPFANLVVLALYQCVSGKSGILFLVLTIVVGVAELIGYVLMSLGAGWASGMGAHVSFELEVAQMYGFINGILSLIALYWVWKVASNWFPNLGAIGLPLGIASYLLGVGCAVLFWAKTCGFATTFVGLITLACILQYYR